MLIQKRIRVSIDWIRPEEGGRKTIISSYHYRPTIIIPKSNIDRHWSFFLDFYSLPEYFRPTIAEGAFLAEYSNKIPWNTMTCGTGFWVMEGMKKIGVGKVIDESREIDVHSLPSYISDNRNKSN